MRPLPTDGLVEFERRVERAWSQSRRLTLKRDALVIGLGLVGLRWIETSRVVRRDLLLGSNAVRVHTAKNGNDRIIPVGGSWMLSCVELLHISEPAGSGMDVVFTTGQKRPLAYTHIRRTVRRWTRSHFGQGFTFHSLRHSAAWRLYEVTRDVLEVQRFLGHASLRHTEEYLRQLVPFSAEGMASFVTAESRGLRVFDPDGNEKGKTNAEGKQTEPAEAVQGSEMLLRVSEAGEREPTALAMGSDNGHGVGGGSDPRSVRGDGLSVVPSNSVVLSSGSDGSGVSVDAVKEAEESRDAEQRGGASLKRGRGKKRRAKGEKKEKVKRCACTYVDSIVDWKGRLREPFGVDKRLRNGETEWAVGCRLCGVMQLWVSEEFMEGALRAGKRRKRVKGSRQGKLF